jgi:hypothetical protein
MKSAWKSRAVSCILEAAGQTLGDPQPTLDLGQDQHAAVRGQPSGVEGDLHGLTGDE